MNSGFFKWVADIINGDNKNTKKEEAQAQVNKPVADNKPVQSEETVISAAPKPVEVSEPVEKPAEVKPVEKPAEETVIGDKIPQEQPITSGKKKQSSEPAEKIDNGIKRRDDLILSTVATIKAYYKGTKPDFTDKLLRLWITDTLFFDTINNQTFIDELIVKMNNETGYTFGKIEVKAGPLPQQHTFTPINNYAHIELLQISQEKKQMRAVIKVVEGCGSTIQEKYILDSEEIQLLTDKRYNIGAGTNPRINNIIHRENYIAIDDNQQSPQYDNNKYVSRAHAHIKYNAEQGFQLYVEKGGSSLAQKRTQVQRNSEIITIDNVLIPLTLEDGDYIILSKHVSLKYNVINI